MKIEKFTDKTGRFRFRIKARNGCIIAGSSEGYRVRAHRDRMIQKLQDELPDATIVEVA